MICLLMCYTVIVLFGFLIVAQHFIQVGSLDVCGESLQIVPVQQPKVCESDHLCISTVDTAAPLSSVVEVSWPQADLSQDILMMYLENQKRSGGGKVNDLRLFAEERKAFVRFVDAECKLLLCYSVLLRLLLLNIKIFWFQSFNVVTLCKTLITV